jgi:hypothetical protein
MVKGLMNPSAEFNATTGLTLKREASVLPILYNCGFFPWVMGHIRCHLRRPL